MAYRNRIVFKLLLFLFFFHNNTLFAAGEKEDVIDLSSATKHFCALTEKGNSYCWGKEGAEAIKAPKEPEAKKIMAGNRCFLMNDDRLSCWSIIKERFPSKKIKAFNDIEGELCLIDELNSIQCYPKNFNPKARLKAKAINTSVHYYCAIRLDDTVYCWGTDSFNWVNQPGYGRERKAKSISSYYNTCSIDFEDNLNCWGDGYDPVPHPKIKAKQVAVTLFHKCAIKMDDAITCWGSNKYGQTDVPNGLKAKKIAVSEYGSCALTIENRVICWGQKNRSQTDMPKGLKVKKLRSSFADMCAIDQKDTLYCWGRSFSDGIKKVEGVKEIAMYFDHYCATKMDDTLECWGSYYGRRTPTMNSIRDYLRKLKIKEVFLIDPFYDCALTFENEVICWRAPGKSGQPEFPSGYRFKSVSFSSVYSCGITYQDQPICWLSERISSSKNLFDIPESMAVPKPDRTEEDSKENTGTVKKIYDFFKGKLSGEKPLPKIIKWSTVSPENIHASLMKVKKILAFRYGACAIKMDDRVICWGNDQAGETEAPKEKKFKDLFLLLDSNTRVCGKDFKNDVICWGDEDREKEHILPYAKVVSIWAKSDGGCVIDIEDEVNCWGGYDTSLWKVPMNSKRLPIKAKQLATTQWSACAVKMDDSLICWGHLHWMKPIMEVVPEEIKGILPQ